MLESGEIQTTPQMPNQKTLSSRAITICVVLCLWAAWLVQYRYHGIFQDTYVYAFLALHHLDPATFQNDLFVRFGSQDRFSFFPGLYGLAVRSLGLIPATLLLTILGQCLWFGGVVSLARRLAPGWHWLPCVAAVLLLDPHYDPFMGFPYGEPHLTPRIFAEAFCLFSLSALWRGRYGLSALLAGAGAMLHPLMASLACSVWGLVFLLDRQWRISIRLVFGIAAALGIGVLAFGVVGVGAMTGAMDTAWYRVIEHMGSLYLFPQMWTIGSLCKLLYFILVFALAARCRLIPSPRILGCLVGAMLVLLGIWLVGSGVFRNVFVTQLQVWRGLWLVQIVGVVANVLVLVRLWQGSCAERWGAAFLTLGFFNLGLLELPPVGTPALETALLGCVIWKVVSLIPARHTGRHVWKQLPLLIPLPQVLGFAASIIELDVVLVPLLVHALIRCRSARGVTTAACALLGVWLMLTFGETAGTAAGMGVFLLWLLATEQDHPALTRPPVKVGLLLVLLFLYAVRGADLLGLLEKEFNDQIAPHLGMYPLLVCEIVVFTTSLLLLSWYLYRQRQHWQPVFLAPLSGLLVLVAAFCFWLPSRAEMSVYPAAAWVQTLQARIPSQAVVLSDRGADWSWFVLHRSFYASHVQLFGAVFSRQNAVEGFRRRQFICSVNAGFCKRVTSAIPYGEASVRLLTDAEAMRLCQEPALDFLVLRGNFSYAVEVVEDSTGQANSVIACAPLRDSGGRAQR